MSRQHPQFRSLNVYKALPLMLLGLLLLVGQLSSLSHARILSANEAVPMVHCQSDAADDCHAMVQSDCCDDSLNDCVIKCAQSSAWMGTLPVQLSLAQVRAMPPPAEQRLTDQPPEPPYQPPRPGWAA